VVKGVGKTEVEDFILICRPNSGDEATLSVDNAQRILILGTAKDFGVCRAT
jgi:hypothetical protein